MPVILAIDATTEVCSVALVTSDGGVKESVSLLAREHTQHILPMIDTLLRDSGLALSELDAIAYGCGPGSFTGLRICLSIAQGLAYGADLPLVAVSSLEAMARGAVRLRQLTNTATNTMIVPAIDARMHEVYWSAYFVNTEGVLEAVLPEQVATPEQCRQQLLNLSCDVVLGLGSGWADEVLQQLSGHQRETDHFPQAYDIAEIAVSRYVKGESVQPLMAQPTYLRNEIHWKKRERIRQLKDA